jgi:PAS domain S-box-containing protein
MDATGRIKVLSKEYNSIATLIVNERSMKGWTQKDLADKIGLSTALVGRWETGDVVLTRKNAELVADAFGLDRGTVVMLAFVDRITESRRKSQRKIQREYARYPKVLELAKMMMTCPKCSDIIKAIDKTSGVDTSYLELALNNMEAGIYIRDMAGNLLYVNEYITKTMKMDREALIGKNIRDFDADPNRVDETTRQLLETGSYTGRIEAIRPDNLRVVVIGWCYLIRDADGEPIGVIGLLHVLDSFKEMINMLFEEISTSLDAREGESE